MHQSRRDPLQTLLYHDDVRMLAQKAWLSGQRILITRARHQAAELGDPLRALGAEIIELPTIAIAHPDDWTALDRTMREASGYDWIIFTSANAVRKFAERAAAISADLSGIANVKIAAIGSATAAELEKSGLHADKVPEEFRAEGVVEAFATENLAGKRILIPRAKVARDVLPIELRKRGAQVDVVEAYRTVIPPESAALLKEIFTRKKPNVITFTSSSTVENFLTLLGQENSGEYLRGVKLASIGPITSETLRRHGLRVDIEATEYTIPALVRAIAQGSK
jgi:uroporphyrinogen III methyltransferase / synthase